MLQQFDNKVRQSIKLDDELTNYSREIGQKFGQHMSEWAKTDGYLETRSLQYTAPLRDQNAANWAPTELYTKATEPFWGRLRLFALNQADECHVKPDIPFETDDSSAFSRQAREVLDVSSQLSPVQNVIARWWADNPGQTSTPPGHWIAIAGQLAKERKYTHSQTTELYAVLGIAMADAFISCWHSKFEVNLLRPKTYIREYLKKTDWQPLLTTPSFPEYPSGHSVVSAAAAEVLTSYFGSSAFTDNTHVAIGLDARYYQDFKHAAQEAGISRLYGGIHFRDAIENGLKQGQCIGKYVLDKLGK